MPVMRCLIRLAFLTVVGLVGSQVAIAQTDSGAVIETSRDGRRIALTLRSGPHPFPGDYPVSVFLPLNYDRETAAYRVLFVFDDYGPNMLAAHDDLVQENLIHPAIIVSIANKTSTSRNYDLTPSVWGADTGGLEVFTDLITHQLKPYLDAHFRTRPERASTGIVGISYGGLAACWLGYFHSDTFGLAGCLEPSLWWNGNQLLNRLQFDPEPNFGTRFWIMAADQETSSMWQNAKYAAQALTQRGWREGTDVAFCQMHNYGHTWTAANDQARSMLHFLLRVAPPVLIGAELTNCHGPQLVPLRPAELGGSVNAYLDLRFRHELRMTAIDPVLVVADPRVATLTVPVLGQLIPAGPGWTTVTTTYDGFRAVIDIQGTTSGTAPEPPLRPDAPMFVQHPANRTVNPGDDVTFSATVSGEGTLAYQWRVDGEAISGAAATSLTLPRVQFPDGGDYDVVVTNTSGTTASDVAILTLIGAPPKPEPTPTPTPNPGPTPMLPAAPITEPTPAPSGGGGGGGGGSISPWFLAGLSLLGLSRRYLRPQC